ncbi:MAG: hypothetical protein EXQ95_06320 [Alphaproteobacteria bacterium]|nr:hypothetical protein [Alphaproteobacteria bacterium]
MGLLTATGIGAVVGAVVVVFFLESTRFVIPWVPGLSAVQGAALREFLIAAALLVVLRFYAKGLVPERIPQPPLPTAPPEAAVAIERVR